MKQQLNEVKRMQKLAALNIKNESELNEQIDEITLRKLIVLRRVLKQLKNAIDRGEEGIEAIKVIDMALKSLDDAGITGYLRP